MWVVDTPHIDIVRCQGNWTVPGGCLVASMELSLTVPDNMEDLKKTLTVAVDPSSKNVTVKGNCPTKDKEPEV